MIAEPLLTEAPQKPCNESRRHIPELDGLRGIAVLMVVAFHCSMILVLSSGPITLLRPLFVPGWTGVDLFLALSGFLITGILLHAKGSPSYFRRFYIRRVLRIFPVYYAALFLCLGPLRGLFVPNTFRTWKISLAYIFHLSNWLSLGGFEIPALNHFWSLALEEQFYLCWPLAIFLLGRQGLTRACLILIAAAPLVRFCILAWSPTGADAVRIAYVLTPARTDALACGALIALCVREKRYRDWLSRYAGPLAIMLLAFLGLWFALKEKLGGGGFWNSTLLSSVLAIAYGLIVFRAAAFRSRILRLPVLRLAGRYSYAAYEIHLPLYKAAFPVLQQSAPLKPWLALTSFLGLIGLTFGLAAISWHCLEKRALAWKEALAG